MSPGEMARGTSMKAGSKLSLNGVAFPANKGLAGVRARAGMLLAAQPACNDCLVDPDGATALGPSLPLRTNEVIR
jgi:hypothetical protein